MLSFRNNCEPLDGFANVRFERGGDNLAKYFCGFERQCVRGRHERVGIVYVISLEM